MKKRYILFALTAFIAFVVCIVPAIKTRIINEQNHRGFAVALEATYKLRDDYIDIYKNAGVDTIIFDEEKDKFNSELISFYKDKGFNIALRIYLGGIKDDNYQEYLNELVKENDIRYIVLRKNKKSDTFIAPIENVIKENNIVLVVNENMNQLSNEMPKGYESYIKASQGRVMRAYETLKNPAGTVKNGNEIKDYGNLIYHHMINSVRDRNTEFMFVNQLENPSLNEEDAVNQTAYAIKKYNSWVQKIGYTKHKTPDLSNYKTDPYRIGASAALIACLMLMIISEIILKKRNKIFEYTMYFISLLAFAVTFIMPVSVVRLYSTAFALVASCFCFCISLYITDLVCRKKGFLVSLISVFATDIIVLFICASIMAALLSGTDYYLNNLIFKGVKITLVFPLLFAIIVSYIYIFDAKNHIGIADIKSGFKKIKPQHIVIVLFAAVFAGIYIMRSGNSQISSFENNIRNFIAEISNARPRTKEFLIGYPFLALFVYYTKYPHSKLIKWITLVFTSILFASVINTFCHVFTDFSISLLRTVNGFIFSVPFVALLLLANIFFVKYIFKRQ